MVKLSVNTNKINSRSNFDKSILTPKSTPKILISFKLIQIAFTISKYKIQEKRNDN